MTIARIYLTFERTESDLTLWESASLSLARRLYGAMSSRAIDCIWASRVEKGTVVDSACVGDLVKLVAIESGAERVGTWRVEERDVFADYVALFGSEPPLVEGVAIMTDTDDTREQAKVWYGDIEFAAREAGE